MKRNPNATCRTCPYWDSGLCRCDTPKPELQHYWPQVPADDWCGQHPDFWEAEAGHVCETANPPTLSDVLSAYRRAVEMAGRYDGRICDSCAHPNTVVCGRCLVGWKLQFQPKESAK